MIDCIICGELNCAYQTYKIRDIEYLNYVTLQPRYYSECTKCGTVYATEDQLRLNSRTHKEFQRAIDARVEKEQGKEKLKEMILKYYTEMGGVFSDE